LVLPDRRFYFVEGEASLFIFFLIRNWPAGEQDFPQMPRLGKAGVVIWAADKRLAFL
jgi:hypothetical protein